MKKLKLMYRFAIFFAFVANAVAVHASRPNEALFKMGEQKQFNGVGAVYCAGNRSTATLVDLEPQGLVGAAYALGCAHHYIHTLAEMDMEKHRHGQCIIFKPDPKTTGWYAGSNIKKPELKCAVELVILPWPYWAVQSDRTNLSEECQRKYQTFLRMAHDFALLILNPVGLESLPRLRLGVFCKKDRKTTAAMLGFGKLKERMAVPVAISGPSGCLYKECLTDTITTVVNANKNAHPLTSKPDNQELLAIYGVKKLLPKSNAPVDAEHGLSGGPVIIVERGERYVVAVVSVIARLPDSEKNQVAPTSLASVATDDGLINPSLQVLIDCAQICSKDLIQLLEK